MRSEKEELLTLRQCAKEWDQSRREFVSTEERLSRLSCEQQLEIHNLTLENRTLFQALHDLQKLRKKLEDRVEELDLDLSSKRR